MIFLVFDHFSSMCLANYLELMRAANTLVDNSFYNGHFLSLEGSIISSSSGLPVFSEQKLCNLGSFDYLFILTSYNYLEQDTAQYQKTLPDGACK